VGILKKVKLRGIDNVGWLFTFTGAAYNRVPLCCKQRLNLARYRYHFSGKATTQVLGISRR
jgi:hypothetical protein